MTIQDMHIMFNLGVDKTFGSSTPGFEPEEIDLLLNLAQERFVKQRYGGMNIKQTSLEETQKRVDDIRNLIYNAEVSQIEKTDDNKPSGVFVSLPIGQNDDYYWFSIQEEVLLGIKDCKKAIVKSGSTLSSAYYLVQEGTIVYATKTYKAPMIFQAVGGTTFTGTGVVYNVIEDRVEVKPITHDIYNRTIKNPFTRPDEGIVLRLMYQDKVELLTDGDSGVIKYYIRYIKKPISMSIEAQPTVDCELAEHTHSEIVDLAISIALENIESRRYNTNMIEQIKQE